MKYMTLNPHQNEVSLRNRGHTPKLFPQRTNLNIRKNAFPLIVAKPWNRIRLVAAWINSAQPNRFLYDYEAQLLLKPEMLNYY